MKEVAVEKDVEATFQKVTDYKDIVSYGVMKTPGLVVDGKVSHMGAFRPETRSWLVAVGG